jgi:hypothetical protein
MARKAKHDQRTIPPGWVCTNCRDSNCNNCLDIVRLIVFRAPPLCTCKRKDHAREARDKQIRDPETGTVYGPGLQVTIDGEVTQGGYDH